MMMRCISTGFFLYLPASISIRKQRTSQGEREEHGEPIHHRSEIFDKCIPGWDII